jgi:zinc transport system substrate-binding protein
MFAYENDPLINRALSHGGAALVRFFLKIICLISICYIQTPAVFAGGGVPVFVSILPQKYFVQQIGKTHVDVRVMVQPGASPATYEPKPEQMAALSRARAYFAVGVPFEKTWLGKIAAANPDMAVIRTDRGIEKLSMHTHGHQGPDAHMDDPGGLDPHIWLSPPLVKKQARAIFEGLIKIDPAHRPAYEENLAAFLSEIEDLDQALRNLFAGHQGLAFMVFHPSWGYFAHRYGLKQVPIEIEGKEPKPAELGMLITVARREGIQVLFAQPQFSTRSADLIAREIGGRVVLIDPLAMNWPENLRKVANQLRSALK